MTEKKETKQIDQATRPETTALLAQQVRAMDSVEQADLYLRVLARLSQNFQLDLDGESRANLQFIEQLMAKAKIDFKPSPETQLTTELRAELHPFQRSAKSLCLIDRLFKAELSRNIAVADIHQQLRNIAQKEREIAEFYRTELQVPLLIRWISHWAHLPELDYLGVQEDQARVQLFDAEHQLDEALNVIHNGFKTLEPQRMILVKHQREDFHTAQEYLSWVTKYMSWSNELFYSLPDAQLGLVLRPLVVESVNAPYS